jgi:outer membrane protein TolC
MKITAQLLFLWIGIAAICAAQTQNKLSLTEALKMGLQKSEDIKIAQQNLKMAQLDNNKGNAGYFPNVSLLLQQQNQYSHPNLSTYFVNQTYTQNVLTPALQAQWTVFNGGKNKAMLQQLYLNQQMAQNDLSIQEQEIIRSIVKKYYTALAEQEKVNILKKIYNLSSRQYDLYQQRQQRGQTSRYETLLTEQNYRSDELSLRLQTLNYQKAMADLCTEIGSIANADTYTLSDNLLSNAPKQYRFESPKSQNPLQKKWQLNTKLSGQNTLLAKSKLYPSISFNAGSTFLFNNTRFKEAASINGSNFDMYLNASINMPLYNGGQIKRGIEKAQIQENIAKLMEQQAGRQLSAELKNKIEQYNQLLSLLTLNEQNNNTLKSAMQLAEQRLQAGLSDLTEVRNLQINQLQSQLKYIDLLLEVKILEADIEYLNN